MFKRDYYILHLPPQSKFLDKISTDTLIVKTFLLELKHFYKKISRLHKNKTFPAKNRSDNTECLPIVIILKKKGANVINDYYF